MSAKTVPLILLCVAYKNRDAVRDFCQATRDKFGPDQVHIAVCDNSPTADPDFDFSADASTARPDNPGYWDGALAAFAAYRMRHTLDESAWVAVTNTDLEFVTADPIAILLEHVTNQPLVIAPRITEGSDEKNPHILVARPSWRLWINYLITATTASALLYLTLSRLRAWARGIRDGGRAAHVQQVGARMYAPYGALIIFNLAFVTSDWLWRGVPLLAEEWAVGEMAAEMNAPVLFEPRVWVRHQAHETTGGKISLGRARMLSRAFRFIWETSR